MKNWRSRVVLNPLNTLFFVFWLNYVILRSRGLDRRSRRNGGPERRSQSRTAAGPAVQNFQGPRTGPAVQKSKDRGLDRRSKSLRTASRTAMLQMRSKLKFHGLFPFDIDAFFALYLTLIRLFGLKIGVEHRYSLNFTQKVNL